MVSSALPTCSPTRLAKGLRPLATASPPSMPDTMPRTVAVSRGSRIRVTTADSGFTEPIFSSRRATASSAASSSESSSMARPTDMPPAMTEASPSSASADTDT